MWRQTLIGLAFIATVNSQLSTTTTKAPSSDALPTGIAPRAMLRSKNVLDVLNATVETSTPVTSNTTLPSLLPKRNSSHVSTKRPLITIKPIVLSTTSEDPLNKNKLNISVKASLRSQRRRRASLRTKIFVSNENETVSSTTTTKPSVPTTTKRHNHGKTKQHQRSSSTERRQQKTTTSSTTNPPSNLSGAPHSSITEPQKDASAKRIRRASLRTYTLSIDSLPSPHRLIATATNDFGFDIYKMIYSETPEKNVFMSPYSVSAALTMALLGANGTTKDAMVEALKLSNTPEMLVSLGYEQAQHALTDLKDNIVSVANKLYVQENVSISEEYANQLKSAFNSDPENVNFIKNPIEIKEKINKFIETSTNGLLKNTLREPLSQGTVIALINAIYFKGTWANPFKKNDTTEKEFYPQTGDPIRTKFMAQQKMYKYASSSSLNAELIEMPYKGFQLNMIIILPNKQDNLAALTTKMNESSFSAALLELSFFNVTLSMPRFKITTTYDLETILQKTAMAEAFSDKADFSRMTEDTSLQLSKVIHQAQVAVDESGTEAAAATVVTGVRTAGPPPMLPEIIFEANRPFMFVIQHRKSGQILFLGSVSTPTDTD